MLMRRSFCVALLLVSLGSVGSSLRAAPANDASAFIDGLVNQALADLGNKQLSPQDRESKFRALLLSDFDMTRISRFVLGRYWKEANDQEKQKFQKLFEEYVVHSYAARLSGYSGQQVKIVGSRAEGDNAFIVMTQILQPNDAPPAKVDWRVRKDGNDFKIVDVDVEGVSMLVTQREEFGTVIQRNGGTVAGLNNALEQKLASGDSSLAAPILPEKK